MDTYLLRDQEIFPGKEVLEKVLADSYPVYKEFIGIISDEKYGLVPQWNYYKDGKAWLCKVVYKKKTVFWLSVWDKYFKIAFYFTEKTSPGIAKLNIDKSILEDFSHTKPAGKLLPLVITFRKKSQIPDALKIIEYKKSLK
jgi:hypothetical protein